VSALVAHGTRGVIAAAVLIVVGTAWTGAHGANAAADVRLTAREFSYAPKEITVQSGDVTFFVRNDGATEHNFVLADDTARHAATIPIIEPGETWKVTVGLRPGTYAIYCSLPGHREAGMTAVLKVQ
jgi:uncharacterized cupredoxin-like copper-binding protein